MPTKNPVPAVTPPAPAPDAEPSRVTLPIVLGLAVFPVTAAVLAMTGMQTAEIIPLLGYSTGIGVAAVLALSGGRRLLAGLAAFAAFASKQ
ncbi:hypothetical protein ACIO8G_34670 [Streptomyces sp. NPDC087219]|uniref:hypothetical protein n=1 Tax=Streptomyces sp. NPDC087219 TaxID=3365770 RepID=UPI003811998E